LGTALKLFPGLLIVTLALSGGKRAALWGIIAALTVLVLSGVIVGNQNVSAFLTQVIPLSRQWYGHDCNFSLMSIGYRLGSMTTGWLLTIIAFIAISLISFKHHGNRDYTYTVGSAGMLIISPLSWLGYGILLLPVLLLLFERISKGASRLDVWTFIVVLALTQFWPFNAEPMVTAIAEYLFYTLPPVIGYMLVIFLACRLLGKKTSPHVNEAVTGRMLI
jgi:Glycosyltransferase family 87